MSLVKGTCIEVNVMPLETVALCCCLLLVLGSSLRPNIIRDAHHEAVTASGTSADMMRCCIRTKQQLHSEGGI